MATVNTKILCQEIGRGSKQFVYVSSSLFAFSG